MNQKIFELSRNSSKNVFFKCLMSQIDDSECNLGLRSRLIFTLNLLTKTSTYNLAAILKMFKVQDSIFNFKIKGLFGPKKLSFGQI